MRIKEEYRGFKRYSANVRGAKVGDCTKRAISLAFDVTYSAVEKEMHEHLFQGRWNNLPCVSATIKALGGPDGEDVSKENYTVKSYMDSHENGIYIFHTEGNHDNIQHLVCAIDGYLYDSWDGSNKKILRVWTIEGGEDRGYTDGVVGHLKELIQFAYDDLADYCESLNLKANGLYIVVSSQFTTVGDYAVKFKSVEYANITVGDDGKSYLANGCKLHKTSLAYVFTPKDTIESAKEKIQQINRDKVKSYIKQLQNELREIENRKSYQVQLYSSREEKFFKRFPEKIKPYITSVEVNGGRYYEYGVTFDIPEWDNIHRNSVDVEATIESESEDDVLTLVKHYVKTSELPDWVDYDSDDYYGIISAVMLD